MQTLEKRLDYQGIILRIPSLEDATKIFELLKENEVVRYVNFSKPKNIDDTRKFLETTYERFQEGEELDYVTEVGGNIIGISSLMRLDWKNLNAELGIWLGRSYWGKGHGKAALQILIDYAFDGLNLSSLTASVKEGNHRSLSLVKKLGFLEQSTFTDDSGTYRRLMMLKR